METPDLEPKDGIGGTIAATAMRKGAQAVKLRDAKEQVERDHPELTGTEKLQAIKALRESAAAEDTAQAGLAPAAASDGFCRNCGQKVKPTVRNGWGKFWTFIALLEAVAVIVSVVACVRPVHPAGGGVIARLVEWPAVIHPVGLGVPAALTAFVIALALAGRATQAAERAGKCPICKSELASQQP